MKVDPRNLRVAEAVRLLNSTPLGEVVQPHLVYRHLNRAAYNQLHVAAERELRIIPGATHLFPEPGKLELVAEMAAEWFVRHLSPTTHGTAE